MPALAMRTSAAARLGSLFRASSSSSTTAKASMMRLRSSSVVIVASTTVRFASSRLASSSTSSMPSISLRSQARRSVATKALTADDIRAKNAENPVVVYSKTYCPYCTEVKALFSRLNVPATVVEIDTLADADDVSAALAEATGRRTVPQVFVGGKHVGGCDDTVAADKSGKLKELLGAVGVKV